MIWKRAEEDERRKEGKALQIPSELHSWPTCMSFSFHTGMGFLRGLSRFIPEIDVADYPALCKRIKKTEIPSIEKEDKDLVIALDSTGVKVTNRIEENG